MQTPAEVLFGFIKEMNLWERRCAARDPEPNSGLDRFEEAFCVGEGEYRLIFEKFCSPSKGTARDFFYSEPPDYDPDGESVMSIRQISPTLAEIQTLQNSGHRRRHLYRLALEDGQWRLFEKWIIYKDGELLHASL